MDVSAISWAPAAALAGTVYAYGALSGSLTNSLMLLAALAVQDCHRLAQYIDPVLANAGTSQILTWAVSLATLAIVAVFFKAEPGQQYETSPESPWTGPGKPLLLPCITTHTRLFPKMHSFVYSYLVVGVPVGWTGACNGMISVAGARQKKGWYHIDAEDYLERGNGHLGLRGKLDAHLVSQGADPARYPHAYLVTAAKFLGYHFNPISFWYLYDEGKTLAAMVLEVNNTFGERRMYYLTPGNTAKGKEKTGETLFKQTWPKDFHVSPFNSRKGSYELLANDPLAPSMEGTGPITATVVLRSSHTHSKIVARLLSERHGETNSNGVTVTTHAQDPAAMNLWHKIKFLASWWWVGFATFPRILKHAGILFLRKRLHVWFRPEPLAKSMGRLADATEKQLEAVFRLYLRHLVENVDDDKGLGQPLAVRYVPCGIPEAQPELMLSPAAGKAADHLSVSGNDAVTVKTAPVGADEIEFHVLTPVFYTRFVHYAHDVEALFCELRESGTTSITPQAAPALFAKRVFSKSKPPPPLQVTSPIDFVMFKAIQKLRHRPDPIQRPMTWPTNKYPAPNSPTSPSDSTSPMTVSKDLRGFRLSAMDGFVLSLTSGEDWHLRRSYRTTVFSLFLADRLAFGSVPLLQLQWLVLRAILAWFVAQGFLSGLRILNMFNASRIA
ncbi:hypothetical protein SEUCBS139899_009803 [Sporothrix eucalyptigena]|uniref:Cyclopropane-fatty-acyl-phospholipid synthase n=1 Tax=Sporothrix eucalyptigena TaxID=1812306 RepID=A0ABP0D2W3_9PEZI